MRRPLISFAAMLAALSCSPEPEGVLDSSMPPPVLLAVLPEVVTVNTDTMNVGTTRLPTDILTIRIPLSSRVHSPTGTSPISSVHSWIADDRGVEISGPFTLKDDGLTPDSSAADGTYSGHAVFSVTRVEIGTWTARVAALGINGSRSTIAVIPIHVVRQNRPPVISELVADTAISSSDPQPLMQLRVTASDPDGRTDIFRVYFDSYRPNGQPSSGNPFLLYDDGNTLGVSGDAVAGDGVFSLRVQFGGAAPGTYRFEFRAIDRSSDTSNVLIHQIQVLP